MGYFVHFFNIFIKFNFFDLLQTYTKSMTREQGEGDELSPETMKLQF